MIKQKLIIFFPVGIGDSLMFTPIINAIKKNQHILEKYEIDALVMNPATKDILVQLDFFKNVFFVNFLKQSIPKSIKEIFYLRKNNYNKSILIFPANLYKYQIIHFLLGAKDRYSHDYLTKSSFDLYWLSDKRITENRDLHSTDENYELVAEVFAKDKIMLNKNYSMSIELNHDSIKFADNYFTSLDNNKSFKYIGIHTGSDTFKNLEHKRWNKDYFIELIERINSCYKNEFHFLLFGIGDEIEINNYINENSTVKNIYIITGSSFLQSAALISKCSFFISNDSGLMHTAGALKIPILSIFGPTNETYTKPLKGINIVSTLKDCDCRPCFEYSKFSLICNEKKKYRCMVNLTPELVFNDFKKLYNQIT